MGSSLPGLGLGCRACTERSRIQIDVLSGCVSLSLHLSLSLPLSLSLSCLLFPFGIANRDAGYNPHCNRGSYLKSRPRPRPLSDQAAARERGSVGHLRGWKNWAAEEREPKSRRLAPSASWAGRLAVWVWVWGSEISGWARSQRAGWGMGSGPCLCP